MSLKSKNGLPYTFICVFKHKTQCKYNSQKSFFDVYFLYFVTVTCILFFNAKMQIRDISSTEEAN